MKITETSKFFNHHYDLVSRMEDKVNKNQNNGLDTEQKVEGIDLMQMFSLAKRF